MMHELVALWNAGERDAGTVAQYLDPDVELESPFSSVAGVPYRGHAGIQQWALDVDEQFAEWHLHLDEVRGAADAVIAIGGVHGRARASGIVFEFPAATLASFGADGRITRLRIYLDLDEALQVAGRGE